MSVTRIKKNAKLWLPSIVYQAMRLIWRGPVWIVERLCEQIVTARVGILVQASRNLGEGFTDSLDNEIIKQIEDVSLALSRHSKYSLYGPAAFWDSLGQKHKNLIRQYGFRRFKRTINFEYFQWPVVSLVDSKIGDLLLELLKHYQIPYGVLLVRIDSKNVIDVPNIRPTAYAVFMGLLWQYALIKDRLRCLNVCDEPMLGEPLPVTYKGKLISQDLATSAIELNLIAKHIDLSRVSRVAEIGAGYGRLAYVAAVRFPQIQYCIFDIPPALVISQNYLASVLGENVVQMFQEDAAISGLDGASARRIRAFLPHQLERFPDGYFDLVINISSFDEMPREQVDNYFALIDQKCSGWLYLKGHAAAPSWCQVSGGGITQLPYRAGWKLVYHGDDPFSPSFVERIYFLHSD